MLKYVRVLTIALLCLSIWGCGTESQKVTVDSKLPQTKQSETVDVTGMPLNQWVAVSLDQSLLKKLQEGENQGHRPSLLLPAQVSSDFVIHDDRLKNLGIQFPEESSLAKDGTITYEFMGNHKLVLHLVQPIDQGKGGIWAVDRYMILSQ